MKRPSNPDQRIIFAKARAAGWRIEETRDGWVAKAPDGVGMVTMHSSSSDVKALQNIKSDFRRAGLDLDAPLPKKPQPTLANVAAGFASETMPTIEQAAAIIGKHVVEHDYRRTSEVKELPVPFSIARELQPTAPVFKKPEPLVTTTKRKTSVAKASEIVWEEPPRRRRSGGRKGPMDKFRSAMVQNPGRWLVFADEVSASVATHHKRQYGKLGFEFKGQSITGSSPKRFKVYARYVGTKEKEAT